MRNSFIFAYVSIAHQNAPADVDPSDLFKKVNKDTGPASGAKILPETPIVKSEVDTTIFGMRGDQGGELQTPPTAPTISRNSTPITNLPSSSLDSFEGYTGDFPSGSPGGGGLDSFFNNGPSR